MLCPKCLSEQPDTSQFCSQCAEPLTEHGKTVARSKTNTWVWFVLGGVACILFMVVQQNLQHAERQRQALQHAMAQQPRVEQVQHVERVEQTQTFIPPPRPLPPPIPQPHVVAIANGAAVVAAASYSWYTFTIPFDAQTISINGRYTATGGRGNDIICYILNDDGFVNFKNGHAAQAYFNSGKMTQGPITAANLPAGTYYLVLDNRYSLITPKAVEINATLSYQQ
jgi:hypothetical protein